MAALACIYPTAHLQLLHFSQS